MSERTYLHKNPHYNTMLLSHIHGLKTAKLTSAHHADGLPVKISEFKQPLSNKYLIQSILGKFGKNCLLALCMEYYSMALLLNQSQSFYRVSLMVRWYSSLQLGEERQ